MNVTAEELLKRLIDTAEGKAREVLPAWIQDNWLGGLSDIIEQGLRDAWLEIINEVTVVRLEADEISIEDKRG